MGLCAGHEIELEERSKLRLATRTPLIDGTLIKTHDSLRVSGRLPCDDTGAAPRCLEQVPRHRAQPAGATPLLGGDGQRHGPDDRRSAVAVTPLELDASIRLVTEPGTLVPHRVETRRTRVRLRLPAGSFHSDGLDLTLDLVFHPQS